MTELANLSDKLGIGERITFEKKGGHIATLIIKEIKLNKNKNGGYYIIGHDLQGDKKSFFISAEEFFAHSPQYAK